MKKVLLGFLSVVVVFFLTACGAGSIANKVEVKFDGYDTIGKLEYNEETIEVAIKEVLLKKVGFKKDDISSIIAEDSSAYALIQGSSENISKYEKFESYYESIEFGFDKIQELANGDTVTFEIKSNNTDSPIKSEKKTFKVEGLKESEKVSAEELIKNQYAFSGYNGYGVISFKNSGQFSSEYEDKESLSNGDEIKVNVSESYIRELATDGKIVHDKSISLKVEGLKEIFEIEGIQDVLAKVSEQAKESAKDKDSLGDRTTYSLEKQKDFLKYYRQSNSFFSSGNGEFLDVVSVYKVIETKTHGKYSSKPEGTVETKEYYKNYGYERIKVLENQLILSNLSGLGGWKTYDNLDSVVLTLKDDNYTEYIPK